MAQSSHQGVRNAMFLLEETPVEKEGGGTEGVARVLRLGVSEEKRKDPHIQPQVPPSGESTPCCLLSEAGGGKAAIVKTLGQ